LNLRKLFDYGNYVVIFAIICGALGIAHGISQGMSAGAAGQYPMPLMYQLLLAGTLWGVIGLLLGAITMTILNLGYWAVPVCLFIALLFSQLDVVSH
jgi:hypothetical protein